MKGSIYYWEKTGRTNTVRTLTHALGRANELGIKHFVIATCSGYTAKKLLQKAPKSNIIAVTHQAGFYKPGQCELSKKTRDWLTNQGVVVYTGTHFFGTIGRAVRIKYGGLEIDELIANTLRIFGQGLKVAVEIAIMAADAGLIPHEQEIVSIGGTGTGADTAIICLPRHGKDFFAFEIREIICKPRRPK
ncbi:hypothetical protein A2Y85_04440 [candidate division WOR-3 bacterium RBG_13_43_14]|uniref:Pyruvate kinase C-terminal domain-containing protein n=1 Tax=candidate division WOR-3 bacterium RBG_13_43_14 TaxID=1802590 RepID=A0A1F4U295_UNCW3|nr:MAG: hypothetical protein A2Y85_04440 [candidate division WOR-3 bacterium RBG_13_43_14]